MSTHHDGAVVGACIAVAFVGVLALSAVGGVDTGRQRSEIERGRYLVEEIAKCAECHTPRDASGNLDHQAWLQGAPIWIQPTRHIPNWADETPPLAGLPSYTDEQMERVLEKGVGPEGEVLRPPMHTYHMQPADAKAIIAYLKSLPRQKH
jgi:mono/diheme cytochrome c family protein